MTATQAASADACLDEDTLRRWVGRSEQASDVVSARLVHGLQAVLDQDRPAPQPGDLAPGCMHWLLAPPCAPMSALGADGHPARGGFLPPVALPRRMWAGSSLRFVDPLRVDDAVDRRSRIADVSLKAGRSGRLVFVAVEHHWSTARGPALSETHDIVYRDAPVAGGPAAVPVAAPVQPEAMWRQPMRADAVMLFRYSALTFNGHRIHYDRDYARQQEGYPGLVVHGPLQATLLIEFATRLHGRAPSRFSFRGLEPLFDFQGFTLEADSVENGLSLWITAETGRRTMTAQAGWDS